mmetsp:Transcript_8145/g.15927  ORF Transcript_8145/g.15927 Transcript_8145/m.15927 type:complete len:125 (+) Transcript_8145:81-455(+)
MLLFKEEKKKKKKKKSDTEHINTKRTSAPRKTKPPTVEEDNKKKKKKKKIQKRNKKNNEEENTQDTYRHISYAHACVRACRQTRRINFFFFVSSCREGEISLESRAVNNGLFYFFAPSGGVTHT